MPTVIRESLINELTGEEVAVATEPPFQLRWQTPAFPHILRRDTIIKGLPIPIPSRNRIDSALLSISPATADQLTHTRSTVAHYRNADGDPVQAAVDEIMNSHYVSGERTILLQGARTNFLHFSAAPATQTRSLAAGTYTLWIDGSGSCALSGGPTGTAEEGSPVTFTLGSTTSVSFTVSGDVDRFQCEGGSFPSSFIATEGDSLTREPDNASVPFPQTIQPFTMLVDLFDLGSGFGQSGRRIFDLGLSDPRCYIDYSTSGGGAFRMVSRNGAGDQSTALVPITHSIGDNVQICCGVEFGDSQLRSFMTIRGGGDFGSVVNGGWISTSANWSDDKIALNGRSNDTFHGFAAFKKIRVDAGTHSPETILAAASI